MAASTSKAAVVRARTGALVIDTLLLAYAAWCAEFLLVHHGARGFLERWPGLIAVTPFLAILWETSATSLGQRGHRLQMRGPTGAVPAHRDRRALWGLALAPQVAVVLSPFLWMPNPVLATAAALGLGLCFAGLSLLKDGRSMPERIAGLTLEIGHAIDPGPVEPWYRRANPWIGIGLLTLTVWVGGVVTEVRIAPLFEGAGRTARLWGQLLQPDWSITDQVVDLMVETVFIALMASVLAVPFAFLLSFFGARNLMSGSTTGRIVYTLTRALMNISRSIEPIVWAIIFTLWVGIGPYAGMLALFVHSTAALGKLYSEAIESIDGGPVEAIRATGANFVQTLRYGVVPQVIPPFLSFTVYRWDINVRMATILGLVGGGGIGDLLIYAVQVSAWSKVGVIILFITLVVWIMDLASAKARERIV